MPGIGRSLAAMSGVWGIAIQEHWRDDGTYRSYMTYMSHHPHTWHTSPDPDQSESFQTQSTAFEVHGGVFGMPKTLLALGPLFEDSDFFGRARPGLCRLRGTDGPTVEIVDASSRVNTRRGIPFPNAWPIIARPTQAPRPANVRTLTMSTQHVTPPFLHQDMKEKCVRMPIPAALNLKQHIIVFLRILYISTLYWSSGILRKQSKTALVRQN
jgi:hypothetical protein